jgi:AcrR family transcriptional regulator
MADKPHVQTTTSRAGGRVAARREAVCRDILDAAWEQMAVDGVAALSVREVARSVGLRQQSLTYYYPSKQALLDALFSDGFTDLRLALEGVPEGDDDVETVVATAQAVVDHCVERPARYHLMLQRTVPGFEPSEASHQVALGCVGILQRRLQQAGVTDPADVAVVRSLISGAAAEQIANDPTGRQYADRAGPGVRTLVHAALASRTGCPAPE